jgi:hypothetical protein
VTRSALEAAELHAQSSACLASGTNGPTAGGQPTLSFWQVWQEGCKAFQRVLGSAISACSVRVCVQSDGR